MSVEEFVDEYLNDTTDGGVILPDRKDEIVQQIESAMATTPAKKKKTSKDGDGEEGAGLMSKLKTKYEAWKESGADEPPKKKAKKSAADDEVSEMFLAYEDHKGKKLDDLKEILRYVCSSLLQYNMQVTPQKLTVFVPFLYFLLRVVPFPLFRPV